MEAIDERKKKLEEEIELQKVTSKNGQEEMQRLFDERQKRIQEEINIEKSKITIKDSTLPPPPMRRRASHFESRLQFKQNPLFVKKESAPPSPVLKPEVIQIPEASDITDLSQEKLSPVSSLTNIVVVPQDSV
jgi:hypothetical protein